uniref:Fatty acid desaturase domain-containing protein n=1 Tax=Meloidogyne incognita TaxID=6306 RepID=A0A914KWK1_MELIC
MSYIDTTKNNLNNGGSNDNGNAFCNDNDFVGNNAESVVSNVAAPNVEELRMSVPPECFEKPLIRSISYLILDLVIISGLYMVVGIVENYLGFVGLLIWYWVLGMYLSSLFCIGHDCGHGTFSSYTWVNDLFGHISHAIIMVPFWPWQKSHRQHHQYTAHLDKDKGHPWVTEEEYESSNWIKKHFAKIPLSGLVRWNPIYTIAGLPDGSHFWPWSKLFENNVDRIKCVVSVSACFLCSFVILSYMNYNLWNFFKYYYVPLMFQVVCFWMVIITFLQHQDEQIEVYEEGTWAFMKGQLQTVDRSFGFGIDKALHHITDGHVAHHFFFTRIPHYNLPKATEAVKKVLQKYPGAYKHKSAYDFLIKFLWLNIKLDCLVGKGSGLLKYRSTVQNDEQLNNKKDK